MVKNKKGKQKASSIFDWIQEQEDTVALSFDIEALNDAVLLAASSPLCANVF